MFLVGSGSFHKVLVGSWLAGMGVQITPLHLHGQLIEIMLE